MTGSLIGLVSTRRGKFPKETSYEPFKWVMWGRDVHEVGAVKEEDAKIYLWVPL
jgi:hypothetical protein